MIPWHRAHLSSYLRLFLLRVPRDLVEESFPFQPETTSKWSFLSLCCFRRMPRWKKCASRERNRKKNDPSSFLCQSDELPAFTDRILGDVKKGSSRRSRLSGGSNLTALPLTLFSAYCPSRRESGKLRILVCVLASSSASVIRTPSKPNNVIP